MTSYRFVKRALDVVASGSALLLLLPIFAVVAVAIKLDSPGPVFFRQERLGLGARPFLVWKFRSMFLGAEKLGVYEAKDDPRVTRVGRVLRRTSFNEVPQLLNILRGEMSVVGPRPVLPSHPWPLDRYTPEQKTRFSVPPGLTGLAQVSGRKDVPWPERLRLDAQYVREQSLGLDFAIMLRTLRVVASSKGNHNASIPGNDDV